MEGRIVGARSAEQSVIDFWRPYHNINRKDSPIMQNDNTSFIRKFTYKLYGGLNMSWPAVIAFAAGSAVLTSVFLIVPVFRDTSFERMGVYFEAWFFLAIIIMANCKAPVESALKTFVFFLISQPLIYLIQVPFSAMGWSLFGYYKTWFIWTLLTLPMAFAGWYITKRNWLSVLILAPVLAFLGITAYQSGAHCIRHFPYLLVTTVFCLLQIILYLITFMPGIRKLAGTAAVVIAVLIFALRNHPADINSSVFLPEDTVLSDSAVVVMNDDRDVQITIESTGEESMIHIRSDRFGDTDFSIKDGDNEYLYTARVYEDKSGHTQIQIDERGA